MRVGIPVLVPDDPGFRNLIDEFACGVCVDPTDPVAIGKAVNQLLSDESLRQKLGENAYRAHREKCNYETQYQPVLELLEQVSRC
jgi:glycosyltransferase involved in cell wall biosynthesis